MNRRERPLVFPTVHLNGSSREDLIAQWKAVYQAADALYAALANACPHGRDYYVSKMPDAINVATRAHAERFADVRAVYEDAEEILGHLAE